LWFIFRKIFILISISNKNNQNRTLNYSLKIIKQKKDEGDDVDYFSELSMGITQPSFKAPAKGVTNTAGVAKVEKQNPK